MAELDEQLERLRASVNPPTEEPGAQLVALLPCEPVVGPVAVAIWADEGGGELIELLRLADGTRITDATALREALTLLAMVETMEELASFELLSGLAEELAAWAGDGSGLPEGYRTARDRALVALDALAGAGPVEGEARMARPQLLDELGGALREVERAWEALEQAAELWSDAHLAAHPGEAALERVQGLWRMLGTARRGPLAQPASAALHSGREAGAAMAAAVTDARRS